MKDDTCVCCGAYVPEGRMVGPNCEEMVNAICKPVLRSIGIDLATQPDFTAFVTPEGKIQGKRSQIKQELWGYKARQVYFDKFSEEEKK